MKLVYIVNRIDGPGGLERVLSIKASMLADHHGYDIHIVTLNQEEDTLFYDFSPKLTYHNITAQGNPITHAYRYASGLRKVVKKLNPDVLVVCDDGLKGFFVPLILGKPCPMIYERHVSKNVVIRKGKESLLHKISIAIKFGLMNFGGKFYNHFIVLTQGNLKEWKLKNLKVIPNPLSFYPDQQSTLQNKKVLAVGKQGFQKGYDRLLAAWNRVAKKHPSWSIDIYGTIDKNEGLDDLAKDLGISTSVHFYPPIKNIAEKYQEASIYVMSSRYEGFGMVLTEAMAYGVPCVSFDCPYGPSDIISDQENGLLVANNDIEGLANGICDLIEHEEKRIMMGKKARIDVQQYLPEKIAVQWDNLFKSLITN
ncbi:glycosyltransferase family 4 protein [Aquimarina sp. 2201CG14-23]|uniref:glycosyltransferase family 4 protein n=1 Tax=Aquimarina mycalae TaxID=3040073 RepID=UPI00247819AA|nr:glycosyltransferase family 4 protein [Aquimarina sp. 2201CG14-23]MDH7446582.1 glycosyltransferase family 4 protein [Aquimarina sp. 2201CG14-23]